MYWEIQLYASHPKYHVRLHTRAKPFKSDWCDCVGSSKRCLPQYTMYMIVYEEGLVKKKAFYMANYGKSPKPKLIKLYCDLKKSQKTEQLEFMTRNFITESDIIQKNWIKIPKIRHLYFSIA